MLICIHCGNTKTFTKECYASYQVNGNDEQIEGKAGDLEYKDDTDYIICSECEEEEIEDVDTEKELLEIKWKHTDKEGKWKYKEIPRKERNEKLTQEIIENEI